MLPHRLFPRWASVPLALFVLLFVAGCGVPGVVAAGSTLPAIKPTPTAQALPPIRLPQDEAPHADMTEWWYYTGHFAGTDGQGQAHRYGFEMTFFQVLRSNLPPIYVGHYAISDITRGQFHFDQRLLVEPGASIPNGTSTTGFNLAINGWTMQGLNGTDHLAASLTDYAVQLTLTSQKPPALHNGNGLIGYGPAGFSYYYSRTHMTLAGSIQDHGVTISVTGLAWMDHQWGNFVPTTLGGWDWFSIQLANGVDYMIYFIRDNSGKVLATLGTRIDTQGNATQLDATQLSEQASDHWVSPVTHVVYPSGWRMHLPDGMLTITPELRDQELVTTSTTGNTYWEGACAITGTLAGQSVTGQGYTELTGYQPA